MKFLVCIFFTFVSLFLFISQKVYPLTLEEEKKYGRELHREILKSVKINSDFFVAFYVEELKRKLEEVADPPLPVKLTVIESRSVEAFATIGGYLYITTGLLEFCETEEELAGVLAHELAHIQRRHIAKRFEKEKYINIGRLATVLLALLVGEPKTKEAIIASGMGTLQSVSLMYSREDELEADFVAATILEKAGFGCLGIVEFLKRLRLKGKDPGLPQYLLTHPHHEERMSKLEPFCRRDEKRERKDDLFKFISVRTKILNYPSKTELLAHYLRKYQENGSDVLAAYGASLIKSILGKREDALKIIESINSRFKKIFLGEILLRIRNYEEAAQVLKGEESPYGKYLLARAIEESGKLKEANRLYSELLFFADSFPEIYFRLGMNYGRSGNEAKGFEYLGRYYLGIGREDEAKTYLKKAISKYGVNSSEAQELLSLLSGLSKR
ncbi:MAG: M48 family metalloprotease [Deltaproteobacteria bacterium]|nr:M48 family metalloprotease [Deltaproteobacteria bacterium]